MLLLLAIATLSAAEIRLRHHDLADKNVSFALQEAVPIGSYGAQAFQILNDLAPHLDNCEATLGEQAAPSASVVHEYYRVECFGIPIFGAAIDLHMRDHRLTFAAINLPKSSGPAIKPDFLPVEQVSDVTLTGTQQMLFEAGGELVAVWTGETETANGPEFWIIDALSGEVLHQESLAFGATRVYAENPRQGQVIEVTLPDLKTASLDGTYFAVFAPKETDPRLTSAGFEIGPEHPDPVEFDQVQVYYGATKALAYFADNFGYHMGATKITVRVNDYPRGRPDNAEYRPAKTGPPQILLGAGNEQIRNLARDNDVITHEFAHHVVYRRLQSTQGESAVLHEGYADYFAYALHGNPYLAESTPATRPYLRTAMQPADARIDDPAMRAAAPHQAGEIWSAMLWHLRTIVGKDFDQLVYQSVDYLSRDSGYADAILGLLAADKALHLTQGAGLGPNGCQIISAAIARGFAFAIADLDGSSCGVDVHNEAEISRERLEAEPQGTKVGVELFGKKCSVIGSAQTGPTTLLVLLLMLMPPLLAWRRK